MKKIIIAAAFIFTASTASAADAVYEAPQAPVAGDVTTFSWTGFTAGVQGGYAWDKQDLTGIAPAGALDANFDGGILGGFAGYNYQLGNNWVVGVEGDFDGNWGDGSLTILAPDKYEYGMDWQGSVRARAGYAFDRALVYGTAGWAIGRGYLVVPGFDKQKESFNGYTVGAGVDYAFTDLIFGRVEYRYTNFGDKNYDFGSLGPLLNGDIDQHAVRVGLGVKF
ncbi:outer membrane protein [Agrobacterium sp. rho-13.3]|uniref:outer membrane protein n=1 Tax=Agrobacterium sp. rho-13.3 TaxID=3072980 RepID=UPI002A16F889|nr:outer membrane protein [Agrobacterium sp. rho-13.3]MDX8307696.1 porin family protein [Agrobacterium sp. rho-13.3]